MANEYVTRSELKATLQIGSDDYADADIDVALEAASRVCDAYRATRFYPTTETRVYTSTNQAAPLNIDDLNALTALTVDADGDGVFEETWVNGTDFALQPLNHTLDGVPANRVVLLDQAARRFPLYVGAVKISGSFGWAATPPNVTQATGILASRLLKRARDTPYAILSVIGVDAVAAARLGRIDPDVALLLDKLPGDTDHQFGSLQLG